MTIEPDLTLRVRPDTATAPVMRVVHPCRCDAPDPEQARMEPLDISLAPLREQGQSLAVCPECDYHILALLDHTAAPAPLPPTV